MRFKNIIFLVFILVSIPVSLVLLSQKTNWLNKAFGQPANLVVDASRMTGGKSESWRYLAQGGEERGRQLLPVVDRVKTLKPNYIRIDHVFDYYTPEELDRIVLDITSTGAKPFIALSYMPPQMAKGGDITGYPNNWADWENLVQKTVERISGVNGLNIKDVYYEVWNEPDLFGKFKYSGSKNYLELYSHTVRSATRAKNVNSFKIGGPAITSYYKNWFDRLISFTESNNLRLDFLSWHRYSKNLEDYEQDMVSLVHYPNRELIITEMGPNSENDKVYDGSFGAIHLIATTALLEGKIDKLFNFEIKDGVGPEKYWGRWGMLTNEKWGNPEIKPRYNAVLFLNKLIGSNNLEVTGQGSWIKAVAKRDDQKIQILVVNYDKYAKHSEVVPLKITNLPSNTFTLKRTDFGGKTTSTDVSVVDNTWETTQLFNPNTASLFEIIF